MEVKVRFKAIGERGNNRQITRKIECPDFEHIKKEPFMLAGKPINCDITVDSQVMDWLDNEFDTRGFMNDHDLHCVIDYFIVKPKEKVDEEKVIREMFIEVLGKDFNEQILLDFMATSIKMKDALKGLSLRKKIDVVLKAQGVGYQTATKALKDITEYGNSLKPGGKNRHLIVKDSAKRERELANYKREQKELKE